MHVLSCVPRIFSSQGRRELQGNSRQNELNCVYHAKSYERDLQRSLGDLVSKKAISGDGQKKIVVKD